MYISLVSLVDLNGTKYLAIEPEARLESNRTSEQKERKRNKPHITEVQYGACDVGDFKLREEVHKRVYI